ncbi:MAG: hypothetical protein AB8B64_20415 [Granulosicoccus sp.]
MNQLTDIFQQSLSLTPAVGLLILLFLILVLGVAAYRLTCRKHINSNGKVVITRKLNLPFERIFPTTLRPDGKTKPFSRAQKRWLRLVYSVHEALFGLVIFALGLGLLTRVFLGLTDKAQTLSDPLTITLAVLGIVATPVGVLLIYFRNEGNPFDDEII